jgi:hypothetical protein
VAQFVDRLFDYALAIEFSVGRKAIELLAQAVG